MKRLIYINIIILTILSSANAKTWRSSLYPTTWNPDYSDNEGRFLHDFSYAGYHYGEVQLPEITKNILDVTKPPYNADNTGKTDATKQIQRALDDAGKKGGGVVFLPAGEYSLSVDSTKTYGLLLRYNNVVLRGAGSDKTFLKNTTTSFRQKQVIYIMGMKSAWKVPHGESVLVTQEVKTKSVEIPVANTDVFNVGDIIVIATDLTDKFAAEHQMTGYWSDKISGQRYCRFIKSIDHQRKTITIDIPIRYSILPRDNARVYKVGNHISEVGLENFSIGNVQNPEKEHWNTLVNEAGPDDLAFMKEGTGPYQIHGTHFIAFRNAINSWARNISSYRPAENTNDIHFVSNALRLVECRNVTVDNCKLQKPQYRGGGGNGYMFTFEGSDCLISNCWAKGARHNYSFKSMFTHGNVLYNCVGVEPRYSVDFHMHLSMANLIDSYVSDGDYIDARFRPWGGISGYMHGHITTESVIWNSKGLKAHPYHDFLVDSRQWGWGYVIGTSGKMNTVITKPVSGVQENVTFDTTPEDFVEGVGKGETLVPQSLYLDQLMKRKARIK